MKIALYALLVLIGIVLLIVLIGWLLPREHVASVEASYRAEPMAVYEAINDVRQATRWRSGLERVDVLSGTDEPLRWREVSDWGTLTFVQEVNEPGRRIVSRIADTDQGFGGTWTYDIAAAPTGTVLRITENGVVSNPLFRFMSRFVFGHYRGLETYARDLGRHFGEDVIVARR